MYETSTPAPLPIVPADILDRFHVNEPYDTRFASGARLLQSIWRERRGLPVGKIKPEKGRRRPLGSRLTPGGRADRRQLPDPRDRQAGAARSRLPRVRRLHRRGAAVGELALVAAPHLQPVRAREARPLARYAGCSARSSPTSSRKLDTIHFETSPGRGDERFTGDNTAFDLLAAVTTPRGTRGFIGIEVKFVESMKYRARPMTKRVDQLADRAQPPPRPPRQARCATCRWSSSSGCTCSQPR